MFFTASIEIFRNVIAGGRVKDTLPLHTRLLYTGTRASVRHKHVAGNNPPPPLHTPFIYRGCGPRQWSKTFTAHHCRGYMYRLHARTKVKCRSILSPVLMSGCPSLMMQVMEELRVAHRRPFGYWTSRICVILTTCLEWPACWWRWY